MRISRRVATVSALGALGVAAVAGPVWAATTEDATGTTRAERIVEALAGLVSDGTLTQQQAEEVATTLDESDALRGPHGGGFGFARGIDLSVAATALGMTEDELRSALEVEGTSLADVADAQGVETSVLVDALVADATERLQEHVADGDLTQAQADERIADLSDRITAMVDEELGSPGGFGPGGHMRGEHMGGGHLRGGPMSDDDDATSDGTATEESAFDA